MVTVGVDDGSAVFEFSLWQCCNDSTINIVIITKKAAHVVIVPLVINSLLLCCVS